MNIYFVYIYRHPITKIPFYVGYGKNNRHLDHLKEAIKYPDPKPKEHKLNTIRKILSSGLEPTIQIIHQNISKEQAIELEIFLISEIGRRDLGTGTLTNLTSGGDGNRDWTPELKKAMSDRNRGIVAAKNPITGEFIRVHKDDPRWLSGELVGQNFGLVNNNKNKKLNDFIQAKDPLTNEVVRVHKDDPRWLSGELVGIRKGISCHENTRSAASKTHKGKKKSSEQNKKISNSIKLLKWYCNFQTNKIGRFKEGHQPDGYVRVSGPHKREII